MAKAFVFPGQGSQFPGMCKDLYDAHAEARELCQAADRLLGFSLTDVMFNGTAEEQVTMLPRKTAKLNIPGTRTANRHR